MNSTWPLDRIDTSARESMATPLVSVIVPVYNDGLGMLTCLQALGRQTYPTNRFEVVVVDNGSQPRIRIRDGHPFLVRLQFCEIAGSYAARNAGVAIAEGEVLAFTDADCTPCPEWVESGVARLLGENGSKIIGGEVLVTEHRKRTGTSLYQHVVGFQQRENIQERNFSATANLFCTAQQFRDIGPFDERLLSGGDREWAWRALRRGYPIVFEPRAVVSTTPRVSLLAAIRQARRVAAGRHQIRAYGVAHIGADALRPHRSPGRSMLWILSCPKLSLWERAKVLNVAILIKTATVLEAMRLHMGGKAERR